jgi:hypothetical protein
MSHLCTIHTQLKSIPDVASACTALGWTLYTGGRVRYYYGEGETCDYTITFGGADASLASTYNLGLQRQPDGTYKVLCDNSMRGPVRRDGTLAGETPRILSTLKHQYAKALVRTQAHRLGARVVEEQLADGTVRMRLSGGRFA